MKAEDFISSAMRVSRGHLSLGRPVKMIANKGAGIYALIARGGDVIYIGETSQIMKRIGEHIVNGKKFVSVVFVPVSDLAGGDTADGRKALERALISFWNPSLNIAHTGRRPRVAVECGVEVRTYGWDVTPVRSSSGQ